MIGAIGGVAIVVALFVASVAEGVNPLDTLVGTAVAAIVGMFLVGGAQ